ncbi:MAG: TatD family hydrolase [Promethearchaeota archaeon]
MKYQVWQKIDCQMHSTSRSFDELRLLKHCGVTDIISTIFIPIMANEAGTFNDLFNWQLKYETERGKKAGINIHPALGIHPMMVPEDSKVLDAALKHLKNALKTKKAVAIGETGLEKGNKYEYSAFKQQLDMAESFNLPVIIHTPSEQKAELTRIIMKEIKKSGVDKCVIDHCTQENAAIVLQNTRRDIKVGLSIQKKNLSVEQAIELYKNYSYENRFVLSSNAGSGVSDILSLVKAVEAFEVADMNPKIIQKLCHDNALDVFRGILSEQSLI